MSSALVSTAQVQEAEKIRIYARLLKYVEPLKEQNSPTAQQVRLFVAQLTAVLKGLVNRDNVTAGRSDVLNLNPHTVYDPIEPDIATYVNMTNPVFMYNDATNWGGEQLGTKESIVDFLHNFLPRRIIEAEMYDSDGARKPPSKICVYTILEKTQGLKYQARHQGMQRHPWPNHQLQDCVEQGHQKCGGPIDPPRQEEQENGDPGQR